VIDGNEWAEVLNLARGNSVRVRLFLEDALGNRRQRFYLGTLVSTHVVFIRRLPVNDNSDAKGGRTKRGFTSGRMAKRECSGSSPQRLSNKSASKPASFECEENEQAKAGSEASSRPKNVF